MLLPDSGHGAHFQHVNRFVRRVTDFLDLQPHGALRGAAVGTAPSALGAALIDLQSAGRACAIMCSGGSSLPFT